MIRFLKKLALSLIGRRTAYRAGRALYQKARGDIVNDIASNGEVLIQHCVVQAWKNSGLSGNHLVVFDVGANVGDWSSTFLGLLKDTETCEEVDLYAFEPVPSTFEYLRNRLGILNPVLHYEQIALSSENGEGTIYVGDQNAGTNSLHADSLGGEQKQIAVVMTTMADYCRTHNLQKVHLTKCDTEGHDMEVIRGALPMLVNGSISVLQFEYNHRWIFSRNYLRDVFIEIAELPYKLTKLQADHLLVLSEWQPELDRFFEGNYALVHVDALAWFPVKQVCWDRYNTMCVEPR